MAASFVVQVNVTELPAATVESGGLAVSSGGSETQGRWVTWGLCVGYNIYRGQPVQLVTSTGIP